MYMYVCELIKSLCINVDLFVDIIIERMIAVFGLRLFNMDLNQ